MCVNNKGCNRNSIKLISQDSNFRYYECQECGRKSKKSIITKGGINYGN